MNTLSIWCAIGGLSQYCPGFFAALYLPFTALTLIPSPAEREREARRAG